MKEILNEIAKQLEGQKDFERYSDDAADIEYCNGINDGMDKAIQIVDEHKKDKIIVYVITSNDNYYQEPVPVKVVSTEEKAIAYLKEHNSPINYYYDYEEYEVDE